MRVHGYATDTREEWTTPFPKARIGFKARLLGGDLLSPDIAGGILRRGAEGQKKNFFNTIPIDVRRKRADRPRWPFLSVRVGRFGFYVGHKVFGVDSPAYTDWPGLSADEVFFGSQAVSGFTARFSTSIP